MMDTEVVLKNLGQNIRELRKNKKMTIDELAEEDYDTLGEESYLYDTLMNLYWLMNAVYSNMLLDSKDYIDAKVIKEKSYES